MEDALQKKEVYGKGHFLLTGLDYFLVKEMNKYVGCVFLCFIGNVVRMQEKMPSGDVSTGLAWGYLLNYLPIQLGGRIWPRGYKTFFMLNSTEHEIFPAHKC